MKNINYIPDLRKRKSWTQEKLADESGLSVRTIQRIESGEDASLETIRVIAQALGVEISDLFEQISDIDKRNDVIYLSQEQENQIKKRNFENKMFIFFRFVFVIFMIFIGNQLNYFSKNYVLIVLWVLWFIFWPVGFVFLSYLRIFWWNVRLDEKYPLTKGINVKTK